MKQFNPNSNSLQQSTGIRYQVAQWNKHFENHKSRTFQSCTHMTRPNRPDGTGYLRVMAEPDGAAIYGDYNMILSLCSRQRQPRDGWLTRDGTPQGEPLTVEDLCHKLRRPPEEIHRTLTFLSRPEAGVGWLIAHLPSANPSSVPTVSAPCPGGIPMVSEWCLGGATELNQTEPNLSPDDKQVAHGVGGEDAVHDPSSPSPSAHTLHAVSTGVEGKVLMTGSSEPTLFDDQNLAVTAASKKRSRATRPETVAELILHFKADPMFARLDVGAQVSRMQQWLGRHPDRRMTRKFAQNWLTRALDDAPICGTHLSSQSPPAEVDPNAALLAMQSLTPKKRSADYQRNS